MTLVCYDCASEFEQKQIKPCKDGEFRCGPCIRKIESKKYRDKYPDRVRESQKKWYGENKHLKREYNREYHKLYYQDHRETLLKKGRAWKLKTKYDLAPDDVHDNCEVCGAKGDSKKPICVDHDHSTGKVRGFLCRRCNFTLGQADDDPVLLEKLALYLRERS